MVQLHNLLYNTQDAMREYAEAKADLANQHVLFIAAAVRKQHYAYGTPERKEAIAKTIEHASVDQTDLEALNTMIEHYRDAYFDPLQDVQSLLQQFKNTLKLDIMSKDKFVGMVLAKALAYKPSVDTTLSFTEVESQLAEQKQQLLDELDALYHNHYEANPYGYTNLEQKQTAMAYLPGVRVRLGYQDTQQPVRNSQVLYWEYQGREDQGGENPAQLDTSDINKLSVWAAETDEKGNICDFITNVSQGLNDWHAGCVIDGEQACVKVAAGKQHLMSPGASKYKVASNRIRRFRDDCYQETSFSPRTVARDEDKPDYKPADIGRDVVTSLTATTNNARYFTSAPTFRPGKTYGLIVYPLTNGHLHTLDLNALAALKMADKAVVTTFTVPMNGASSLSLYVHCNLPQWNQRLIEQTVILVDHITEKKREQTDHTANQWRLKALAHVAKLHKDHSVEPLTPQNKLLNDKLIIRANRCADNYQKVIEQDVWDLSASIEKQAQHLIDLLSGEAFSAEFTAFLQHVNAAEDPNPAGPYAKIDTGWRVIFQTFSDCLLSLHAAGKAKEAFDTFGLPYLMCAGNADDRSVYEVDSETEDFIYRELSQLDSSNAEAIQSLIDSPYKPLQFPNINQTVLAYMAEFFKDDVLPVTGMINNVPGPASVLQSLVFSVGTMGEFFMRYSNNKSVVYHLGNTIFKMLHWVATKKMKTIEYGRFLSIYHRYLGSLANIPLRQDMGKALIKQVTRVTDVSNAHLYRSFCIGLGLVFSALELHKAYASGKDQEMDGEYFFRHLAPHFMNFTYANLLLVNRGVKIAEKFASPNRAFMQQVIQRMASNQSILNPKFTAELAGRLGYVIAIYATAINAWDAVDRHKVGDTQGLLIHTATAFSNLAIVFGFMLPGLAAGLVVGLGVALIVGLYLYARNDINNTHSFVLGLLQHLEPLWLKSTDNGRQLDLRPGPLKGDMQQAQQLINAMQWHPLQWQAVIPLSNYGMDVAQISNIIEMNRNLPHLNQQLISQLQRYCDRLQQMIHKTDDDQQTDADQYRKIYNALTKGKLDKQQYPTAYALPDYKDISSFSYE